MQTLITPSRVAATAMREGEAYLKKRIFAVEAAAVREQAGIYRRAYTDLRNTATALMEQAGITHLSTDTPSSQFKDAFLHYAHNRLAAVMSAVEESTITHAAQNYLGGYYGRLWLLDVSTKPEVMIKLPAPRGAGLQEASDPYSGMIRDLLGKEWRAQYANEIDSLELGIRRAIGSGISEGQGIPEIMRRVSREMGVQTDRRRGAAGSAERASYRANFNRVQAITRTVVNAVSNAGAVDAYRANSDILSGYEWLTARDERVCPQCAGYDGRVMKLGSAFRPPAHPNCRCTVIPVIKAGVAENPQAMPKINFKKWSEGFGMDKELGKFINEPLKPKVLPKTVKPKPASIKGLTPTGQAKVSDGIRIPSKGKLKAGTTHGVELIDQVHGARAGMPQILVESESGEYYGIYRQRWYGKPDPKIGVNPTYAESIGQQATTVIHEYGHYLDNEEWGIPGTTFDKFHPNRLKYGDWGNYGSTVAARGDPHIMSEWWEAVRQSPEYARLTDQLNNPHNYKVQTKWGMSEPSVTPLRYYLQPHELWARSYEQFIAVETGDSALLEQTAAELGSPLYGAIKWTDEGFAPIREAMQKLFRSMGWAI